MELLMGLNQIITAAIAIISEKWIELSLVLIIPFFFRKVRNYFFFTIRKVFFVNDFMLRKDMLIKCDSEQSEDLKCNDDEVNPVLFGVIPPPEDVICESRTLKAKNVKTPSQKRKNAKLFFTNLLCDFSFTIYSDNVDSSIRGINSKVIIDTLLPILFKENKPQIVHIHGEIGSGKSTLMGAIINELSLSNSLNPKGTQYLPVVIDVRVSLHDALVDIVNHEDPTERKINEILESALVQASKNYICSNYDNKFTSGIRNAYDMADIVNELVAEKLVSPIFFIDELDTIYSLFCKNTFCEVNNITKDYYHELYQNVIKYFVSFQTDDIGNARFNKCAFFIAYRTSTEKFFEEIFTNNTNLSRKAIFGDISHSIELDDFDSLKANKIIKSRAHLKYIHVRDKKRQIVHSEEILKNLADYEDVTLSPTYGYEKNINISIHGMRHIMNLLGKAEASDPTCFLLSGFIKNPGLLRTFQYLDGVPDFSKSREGMSNIFLINRDYVMGKYANDKTIKSGRWELTSNHLYTFTLKYILFGYIVQISSPNKKIFLDDILQLFCYRGGKPSLFEESIVRLVLFNSTEVEHGRLMKMGWDNKKLDYSIEPSDRCKTMFNSNMFWEFGYLMVMVEDKWLEYPPEVAEIMVDSDDGNIIDTYEFITSYNNSSKNEKIKFLKYKAKMVLKFCYVLEMAFKYEKRRYNDAYSLFFDDLADGASHLDIEAKIMKVEGSIISFTENYVSSDTASSLKKEISTIKNTYRKDIHKKMKAFYREYHQTFSLLPLSCKMKKYHNDNLKRKLFW